MTMASYDTRTDRQSVWPSFVAPIYGAFESLGERLSSWNRHRQEIRALESLPADLRKDFGWPGADRFTRQGR